MESTRPRRVARRRHPLHGRDRVVHLAFDIGVFAKGVDGVLEIVGGILLLVVSSERIGAAAVYVTHHVLHENSQDFFAHLLTQSVSHLTGGAKLFGAVFLFWHGAIKVGLVWALLRRQWWAYPVAMAAFAIFVAYQLYRYTHTHSIWLIGLSLLDCFVIVLTWLEYQRLKRSHEFNRPRAF